MRAMKDSGIEWIGQIPQDWQIAKVKHVYSFQTGWTPSTSNAAYFDGDLPWANISDIGKAKTIYDTAKHITEEAVENSSMGISPKGSLMYSFKLSVGDVSFCGTDMYTNEAIATFLPSDRYDLRYLFYAAPLFIIKNANENIYGAKLLNQELIRNALILNPPYNDQVSVADYLDARCAEIDALIAAKEKTNALLKERRQSIIYEAVTKGLNPDAPMKDSGTEWIGQIPTSWDMLRLRFLGTFQNGISKAGEFFGSGHPFVSYGDVYKNEVLPTAPSGLVESTESEQELYSVEKGDVFFTRTSETKEEIGIVAVCKETIPNATFAGFLIRMRPTTDVVVTDFLRYYFSCGLQREYFSKEMTLVTRASLGQDLLKNMVVTIPSAEEQKEIVIYLDEQTQAIDSIIANNDVSIQKLKEYRQSIIYEAVTGKIEV